MDVLDLWQGRFALFDEQVMLALDQVLALPQQREIIGKQRVGKLAPERITFPEYCGRIL